MSRALSLAAVGGIDVIGLDSVVVAPYFGGSDLREQTDALRPWNATLTPALQRGEIRPSLYEVTLLHSDGKIPGLLVIGAGSPSDLDGLILIRLAATASRYLTGKSYAELAWLDTGWGSPHDLGRAVAEGAIRGAYDSALRKTGERRRRHLAGVTIVSTRSAAEIQSGMAVGKTIGDASRLARDLVNMPPNELTPVSLAWKAEELAHRHGLKLETLDETHISELGMGALLGVSSGSERPPRVICLRAGPDDAPIKLAFVGKGITFDSGGLQSKSAEGMLTMKGDVGGAAAVLAALVAVSELDLSQISIAGYMGATENMPGGNAMRPGDVLTAMNGKTIEVLSTDAEGRLVLADLLSYAVRCGATHIVDIATLTGGARVALGSAAFLAAGRPPAWVDRLVVAAADAFERAWPMPLYPEYRRAMDSEIADMKNTGGRAGTALNATAFLSEFVGNLPWAHLDIAPTGWSDEATPYQPKGGTGSGVGTLVALARRLNDEQRSR